MKARKGDFNWNRSIAVAICMLGASGCSHRTETNSSEELKKQVEELRNQNQQLQNALAERRAASPIPTSMPSLLLSSSPQRSISNERGNPIFTNAQYDLAQAAFRKKDYAKARERFKALLTRTPDDQGPDPPLIKFKIYMTLLLEGKESRAEKMIPDFAAMGDTPALYYAHAAREFKHNNATKAAEWLRSAHEIYPPAANIAFVDSFYNLGWMETPITATENSRQAEFAKNAMNLREQEMLKVEPQTFVPTTSRPATRRFPLKTNIVTSVFWIGEKQSHKSAWDANWTNSYGGFDTPEASARRNYIPVAFIPRQNPFYCALPYNDITHGQFKREAPLVIPWFKQFYTEPGRSVCKSRWLAIRKGNRACYAQWEDCGPFRMDHFQYVFGKERPKPNLQRGAGLSVSPAVRDYLGLAPTDVTDWQFVEVRDIPPGPWMKYGENNNFVIAQRQLEQRASEQQNTDSNKPQN